MKFLSYLSMYFSFWSLFFAIIFPAFDNWMGKRIERKVHEDYLKRDGKTDEM